VKASFRTLAHGFGLVEGPTLGLAGELYVSDVTRGGVYRIDLDGGVETVIPKRRGVGGIALHADGGLVVSGRDVQHVRDGEIRQLFAADRYTGFNDLCCDAAGRIYAGGVRFFVFEPDVVPVPGELLRIDRPGAAETVAEEVVHTNGVGLSPDGRTLFHSDTRGERVLILTLDEAGDVVARRDVPMDGPGVPDGLAVDAEGCAWVAMVEGGSIVRLTPEGEIQDVLETPAAWPTSLCFVPGGLVVVSADNTEDPSREGSVFLTDFGVEGAPVHPCRI
jgi:gluconolactonase